jgi:hypothetical protein
LQLGANISCVALNLSVGNVRWILMHDAGVVAEEENARLGDVLREKILWPENRVLSPGLNGVPSEPMQKHYAEQKEKRPLYFSRLLYTFLKTRECSGV